MVNLSFKMDRVDCENVLRGKVDKVYDSLAAQLVHHLVESKEPRDIYFLQGQIKMLDMVMDLRNKAQKQIEK